MEACLLGCWAAVATGPAWPHARPDIVEGAEDERSHATKIPGRTLEEDEVACVWRGQRLRAAGNCESFTSCSHNGLWDYAKRSASAALPIDRHQRRPLEHTGKRWKALNEDSPSSAVGVKEELSDVDDTASGTDWLMLNSQQNLMHCLQHRKKQVHSGRGHTHLSLNCLICKHDSFGSSEE
ncbi:hypothetical protein NQZ68_002936 [Dissostichus eleginoides]|nr:hypothetical protein NQZ68_002936 [Dissostichus eleginoides]